jgi:hypothetical protein
MTEESVINYADLRKYQEAVLEEKRRARETLVPIFVHPQTAKILQDAGFNAWLFQSTSDE